MNLFLRGIYENGMRSPVLPLSLDETAFEQSTLQAHYIRGWVVVMSEGWWGEGGVMREGGGGAGITFPVQSVRECCEVFLSVCLSLS